MSSSKKRWACAAIAVGLLGVSAACGNPLAWYWILIDASEYFFAAYEYPDWLVHG